MSADALLRYECPRCRAAVDERFYGPCRSCRDDLSTTMGRTVEGGAGEVATDRFEPGMHVVPNHVATKE